MSTLPTNCPKEQRPDEEKTLSDEEINELIRWVAEIFINNTQEEETQWTNTK